MRAQPGLKTVAAPGSLALFGPGLIGGSILRRLLVDSAAPSMRVWGRDVRALAAVRDACGDRVYCTTDPAEAVAGAEGVILCTPIEAMADLARQFAPALPATAWVTDVGSVKSPVVEQLEPLLGERFLGAHPMAGSEKTGFAHSSAHLFAQAVCILTPTSRTGAFARQAVAAFWQGLGCRVVERSPVEHDRAMALISHLPHLVAAALVLTSDAEARALAGPGFRDCTRIAMSDAQLWQGILRENRSALLAAVEVFRERLEALTVALAQPAATENSTADPLRHLLAEAGAQRRSLVAFSPPTSS